MAPLIAEYDHHMEEMNDQLQRYQVPIPLADTKGESLLSTLTVIC